MRPKQRFAKTTFTANGHSQFYFGIVAICCEFFRSMKFAVNQKYGNIFVVTQRTFLFDGKRNGLKICTKLLLILIHEKIIGSLINWTICTLFWFVTLNGLVNYHGKQLIWLSNLLAILLPFYCYWTQVFAIVSKVPIILVGIISNFKDFNTLFDLY